MKDPSILSQADRLASRQSELPDLAQTPQFDDFAHLAAQLCGAPMAAIIAAEREGPRLLSSVGLEASQVDGALSMAAAAWPLSNWVQVADLRADERFSFHLLVCGEPHLRFFGGAALIGSRGQSLGSLCVFDKVSRQLDAKQQEALRRLARQTAWLLEAPQQPGLAGEAEQRGADSLRLSDLRYRRLFDAAKDGILILDAATGQIEDVNPYLCQLLGYGAEHFVGRHLWEIGAFRDIAASQDAFRELQQKETIRYSDLPLETRSGEVAEVEFVSNVYSGADKPLIQCNIRDIGQRKEAARDKRESERFLQSTLDALASHITVLDEQGEIIAVNKAWRQFAEENQGSAASCGVGANYLEACRGETGEAALQTASIVEGIREVMAGTHQAFCVEYPCHSPTQERWFNVCVTPLGGEGPVRVVIAHENTTARKQAEEELRVGQIHHRAILQSALEAIISMDEKGQITEWNPAAEKIFGYAREFAMGRVMADLIVPPHLREQHWEGLQHYLQSGEAVLLDRRTEITAMRADGSEFPVELAITRHLIDGPPTFTGYIRDITHRKRATEQLHFQKALLEAQTETSLDGILVVSRDGKILSYNRRFAQMWDISDQLKSSNEDAQVLEVILDKLIDPRQFSDRVAYLSAHEEEQSHEEIGLRDGRVFDRYSSPIASSEGAYYGRVWYFRDITERKQASEAMARLAAIVEFSNDAIVSKTLTGIITSWNASAEMLYGYSREEVIGRPVLMLLAPDRLDEETTLLGKIARGEHVANFETVRVRKNGEMVEVSLTLSPVKNEAGEIIGASTITRNIGDRKRGEKALRESEERFQSIVASVPGMVYQFVLHPDGTMEWPFVSEGCRELNETDPETLKTDPYWPIARIHPDDRDDLERSVATSAQTLLPWVWEGRNCLESGKIRWVRGASRPRRLPDGGTLWNGLVLDITARKEAEEALQKANDELELHVTERTAELALVNETLRIENIQHEMTMGSLRQVADALQGANQELRNNEARLLQGNRLFTDLTRLRASQSSELDTALQQITEASSKVLDSERCSIWLYNEDKSAIQCLDLYETATGRHSRGLELTAQEFPDYFQALESEQTIVANDVHDHLATREFSEHYLQPLNITGLLDTIIVVGGQITGVLCCERTGTARAWKVEDQTFAGSAAAICSLALESFERAKAESEMRQAREEADAANLAKSEFLSRMSHELRTPLNAILGFGQILDKQDLTPIARESVGYILKGGRHLLDLINEVLDIARVEAGHLELSPEPIDLADIVPEACALVGPLAAERAIHLHQTNFEAGLHHVWADRQRLKQVIINLLSNAIKYNHQGGEVEVTWSQKTDGLTTIAVRDTGPGISPPDLLKIFIPFERLGASADNVEGTGLGLVLSQRLVTEMGGTLTVESTLGQGTTFNLGLPQTPRPKDPLANLTQGERSVNTSSSAGRTFSVLSIEDNPSNLRLLDGLFQSRPEITFLTATKGGTGLELARQHEPDLILLDLNLPDIHGKEVLIRLQHSAITRDIPVVVVSADDTPQQKENLLALGAREYLTKPLDVNQFFATVDNLLALREVALPADIDEESV